MIGEAVESFAPPRRSHRAALGASLAASDMLCLALAAVAAYSLSSLGHAAAGGDYVSPSSALASRGWAFAASAAALVAWFHALGHHQASGTFWEEAKAVASGSAVALLGEAFLHFADKADVSRLMTFGTWALAPLAVMAGRRLSKTALRARGLGRIPVVVVGPMDEASAAAAAVTADPHLGYEVRATIPTGSVEAVAAAMRDAGATTAVVALGGADPSERVLVTGLRGLGARVVLVPPAMGLLAAGMRVQYVMGQDAFLIVDRPVVAPQAARFAKRTFDVAVSAALLVVFAPPMAAVAVAVLRDGGPALFGHERVGRGGRTFRCWKFRSMRVDSDEALARHLDASPEDRSEWEATRKLRNDPRVTRVGRVLRSTALDELPQLANVLLGDMSLVGPRPVTRDEIGSYGASASLYSSVRPGITGLWQVSGRSDLSYPERVALDAWYVRNWSAWHDLAILAKTVPAVLSRRGAY